MVCSPVKFIISIVAAFLILIGSGAFGQTKHSVYFEKTDHELHVYRIIGDVPGATLMILGGIQGDEPSGYLTADLYADIKLRMGNMIVVPRANFYSIVAGTRNGVSGDMNRKFHNSSERQGIEGAIVEVLKEFIHESDVLVNLHEGSGYYNEQWISDEENPSRYGQSIIYDTEEYLTEEKSKTISLGTIARSIVDRINRNIEEPRYRFRVNNHDTLSARTGHPEQRKSASYFALTQAHIPAFGIEISKNIPDLDSRVRLHKIAVNAVMEEFGIELDLPGSELVPPQLKYLLVKINRNPPYALSHGKTLPLQKGDRVTLTDIVANYDRGLVADIAGYGSANDLGKSFIFAEPTRVLVRKDAVVCGWIDLVESPKHVQTKADSQVAAAPPLSVSDLKVESLMVEVDGKPIILGNGRTLYVPSDATLILRNVKTNLTMLNQEVSVNFKGFVPPKSVNDGNDINYPIALATDLWTKYSETGQGKRYPIIFNYLDKPVGNAWVVLTDGQGR